ncbi:formyl-CoA transferase [Sphingobium faniae]|nr:formyl-CoA transferase [Sphingobium faniae]
MTASRFPDYIRRQANAPSALEGLRVIDFTQMLAGPYSTQELADLGADVIKVEVPGKGDDSRHYTTTALAGECAFYLSTNRNKRSFTLDLKTGAGRKLALDLIAGADIVVENFSNGVMERLGLDYDTVSRINPQLIYCSISGYGRDDAAPVARRGYDAMFQACSGFMSMTGDADRLPMRTTVPIIDTVTAMTATSAILAAVIARYRLGKGQFIEVALLDVAMSCLTMYGMAHLVSGKDMQRNGNRAPQTAPSDVYQTQTGPLFLTCGNQNLFRRLCVEGFERDDLVTDPDFATNSDRVHNVARLTEILSDIFASNTREYWIDRLSGAGVPVAPVATIREAVMSADVTARNIITEIPHPKAGAVPNIRSPYRMSLTPCMDAVAAPLLGQHNQEILQDILHLDSDAIETFARQGAFGPEPAPEPTVAEE